VTDRKDTRPGRPLVAWRHRAFRGGGDGAAVPKVQRGLDEDFKSGAVRLVFETGKPMAQVARELGVNEGTLGNWVAVARHQRVGGDGPLSEDEWVIRSWRPRSKAVQLGVELGCQGSGSARMAMLMVAW
jgi:transposase-like protein